MSAGAENGKSFSKNMRECNCVRACVWACSLSLSVYVCSCMYHDTVCGLSVYVCAAEHLHVWYVVGV